MLGRLRCVGHDGARRRDDAGIERGGFARRHHAEGGADGPFGPADLRPGLRQVPPARQSRRRSILMNKNLAQTKMVDQIRHGTGRMRAISLTKLPEAQMPALLTYLRTLHALQ